MMQLQKDLEDQMVKLDRVTKLVNDLQLHCIYSFTTAFIYLQFHGMLHLPENHVSNVHVMLSRKVD